MIILDDTKSLSVLANDTSNGLGQIGCINPTITENLNGSYELEFDIATSEKYFSLLKVGGLVKCLHNTSEQIFRIYFISKPINSIANVRCQHISYDLTGVVVKPFTATGAVSSVNGMLSNVIGSTPFTMTTDITNTTSNFTLDIPRSFRECLGGYEGSLLDVFRGEYEWDNLTVRMLAHRGADNGVRIAYGKNLTDFTQEENIENVFDAVYGYAVIDDVFYQPSGIYNKTGATTPKVKIVDFSSDYESGDIPSQADLYAKAQTYATNNPIEVPNVNIKVSFVPLWQTEEYKNILPLERVSLGDTVHVFFEKLNVEATARVIKTVWNVNLERYDEIELGDAKANLNTVINESVDSAVNDALGDLDIDTGAIESEMFQMSKLIANGMGLHMTKDSIGRIYLHNAEDLSQSQYQYMITSNGFMISNNYGQEGSWTSGWDADGNVVVNSLATITLKFLQGYGMYMRFGDINSNYIEVAPYSDSNNNPMGVSFDGSGSIRMRPQGIFGVYNRNETLGKTYNSIVLNKDATFNNHSNNAILLTNYDDTNNYLTANAFEFDAHAYSTDHQAYFNRLIFWNYQTVTGNRTTGNYQIFSAFSNRNTAQIFNYKPASSNIANSFEMKAISTENYLYFGNRMFSETREANYISMTANSTTNSMYINNMKFATNVTANNLSLSSTASKNQLSITNNQYQQDNSQTANEIKLSSESNLNAIVLNNYFNQELINKIEMGRLSSGGSYSPTTTIWSQNDLRLWSRGAVRINANIYSDGTSYGGDQDIFFTGTTMHFYFTSKFSFHYGSQRYDLDSSTFSNISVGDYAPVYMHRVN